MSSVTNASIHNALGVFNTINALNKTSEWQLGLAVGLKKAVGKSRRAYLCQWARFCSGSGEKKALLNTFGSAKCAYSNPTALSELEIRYELPSLLPSLQGTVWAERGRIGQRRAWKNRQWKEYKFRLQDTEDCLSFKSPSWFLTFFAFPW